MKALKAVALTVGGLIAVGSITAGILNCVQQQKAERIAKLTCKTIHKPYGPYEKYFKRPFDFALSSVALVVLSPVILALAVAVRIKLGAPVLFRQERPGKDEKLFTLIKFRSLTEEKGSNGEYLSDEKRLTAFGAWERSTSLDELPELTCIWKGSMSIVGPRPLLVRDMVFMTPEQRRRHDIRPGLTGLAQISGRNAIEWKNKLRLDNEYLTHITFWGDLKIIVATVGKVLSRAGITQEGMATAMDYGDYLLSINEVTQEMYSKKQNQAKELLSAK